jgi:hypothetical protein
MNDIMKGKVNIKQDVCTIQFVFAYVCVVAWQDSIICTWIFQHTPWDSTLLKEKQKKWKEWQEKRSPPWTKHTKV